MTRAHAEEMRAYAERVLALPIEERSKHLAEERKRHDALGYARARESAATARVGDFGAPAHVEVAAPVEPKAEIASFEPPPPPPPAKMLVAYTDGSGTQRHLPSGAGVVVYDGDEVVLEASRHLGNGTNNHAELSAIRVALAITDTPEWRGRMLTIRSDSLYAIGAVTAPNGPLAAASNVKLIYATRALLEGRVVVFEHVKGHSGVEGNERADKLAGLARVRPQTALRRAG